MQAPSQAAPLTWSPRFSFPRELLASVVVFLVALPLCLGIAIASGAPPAAGLITGIIGGLVVGTIGGSPLQVSGPAAGLAVVAYELVQKYGVAGLGVIVVVGGLVQVAAGLAKLGRWFQAVPPAVVHGMLAGIGVLIFGSQFHVMVDDTPKGSGIKNLITIPFAVYKGVTPDGDLPHNEAAALGLATIVIIVVWNGPLAGKFPKLKMIPGALPAVVLATVLCNVLAFPVARVSVPPSLVGALTLPTVDSLSLLVQAPVLGAGLALAVIASAETLLCATALDRMHRGPRTNYDRELFAQGIGNVLCGALGALPMTGVIVRSSANLEAGAKTRASAILHGAWLLVVVAAAPFLLRLVPVASLAALLVFTGYKLMRQDLAEIRQGGRFEVFIFFATIAGIVALDLLKGVLLGLALAVAKLVRTITRLRVRMHHEETGAFTSVQLKGSATFLRLPDLEAALQAIPPKRDVHVELDSLDYADHAALQAIKLWEKEYVKRGGTVTIDWDDLELRKHGPAPSESFPER